MDYTIVATNEVEESIVLVVDAPTSEEVVSLAQLLHNLAICDSEQLTDLHELADPLHLIAVFTGDLFAALLQVEQ